MRDDIRPLALVTSASGGIGYELACMFAERGYDLVVVSDNRSELEHATASLSAMHVESTIHAIEADLSNTDGVMVVYRAAMSLGRPVDMLVANAGSGRNGRFETETDLDAEIELINLSVTSQVHLIRLFVFDMVDQGAGDVVITSSSIDGMTESYKAVHTASKAFLRCFGQALRHELKDTGVSVNVLIPDATDTKLLERADIMITNNFGSLRNFAPGIRNKLQVDTAKPSSRRAL